MIKYRSLEGYKYETLKTYQIKTDIILDKFVDNGYIRLVHGNLIIRNRYAWDGASFIIRDTDNIMEGSLVHDALYQLMRLGLIDRDKYRIVADKLLYDMCIKKGMSKFRAWYIYRGLRWFGKKASMPNKKKRGKVFEI